MTIFNIDIVKYNCETRELLKSRNFYRFDSYRGANIFVGFMNKLLDDAVFENEDGRHQADEKHENRQQCVENDFSKDLQERGLMLQKYRIKTVTGMKK